MYYSNMTETDLNVGVTVFFTILLTTNMFFLQVQVDNSSQMALCEKRQKYVGNIWQEQHR